MHGRRRSILRNYAGKEPVIIQPACSHKGPGPNLVELVMASLRMRAGSTTGMTRLLVHLTQNPQSCKRLQLIYHHVLLQQVDYFRTSQLKKGGNAPDVFTGGQRENKSHLKNHFRWHENLKMNSFIKG